VPGQLPELAISQEIGPAVSDVNNRDLVVGHERAGKSGSHATPAGVRARSFEDLAVGLTGDVGKPFLCSASIWEFGLERIRSDLRGNLAGSSAAHTVRNDEHRRAREIHILVGIALAPCVGLRRVLDYPQHDFPSSSITGLSRRCTLETTVGCSALFV